MVSPQGIRTQRLVGSGPVVLVLAVFLIAIFFKIPLAMFLIRMHNTLRCVTDMVGVAQLARATGCGPVGRGFESLYPPHSLSHGRCKGAISSAG